MYNDVNLCVFTGTLGRDADLKYTASGVPVATLNMAVNGSRRVDGNWENTTTWVNVVRWFKSDADDAATKWAGNMTKGTRIGVEGRWQTRTWEDKSGNKRYSTDLVSNRVHIIGKKEKTEPQKSEQSDIPF